MTGTRHTEGLQRRLCTTAAQQDLGRGRTCNPQIKEAWGNAVCLVVTRALATHARWRQSRDAAGGMADHLLVSPCGFTCIADSRSGLVRLEHKQQAPVNGDMVHIKDVPVVALPPGLQAPAAGICQGKQQVRK